MGGTVASAGVDWWRVVLYPVVDYLLQNPQRHRTVFQHNSVEFFDVEPVACKDKTGENMFIGYSGQSI